MGWLERLVELTNKSIQKITRQVCEKFHQKITIAAIAAAVRGCCWVQICIGIDSAREVVDQRSRRDTLGQELSEHLSAQINRILLLQEKGENRAFFRRVPRGHQRWLREDAEESDQPVHPIGPTRIFPHQKNRPRRTHPVQSISQIESLADRQQAIVAQAVLIPLRLLLLIDYFIH